MTFVKGLSEKTENAVAKTLRTDCPYLSREAMSEIIQQCRQTVLSERIREYTAISLRAEFPMLKQDALDDIAMGCRQVVKDRLKLETLGMAESQERCHLLSLPAEIRNRISELLVTIQKNRLGDTGPDGKAYIELAAYEEAYTDTSARGVFDGDEEWTIQPPLTQVCRQLRAESLPIYYNNTFLVFVWDHGLVKKKPGRIDHIELCASAIKSWLTSIGAKNRALIKSLVVCHAAAPHFSGKIAGWRLAAAPKQAGLELENCAIKSYKSDYCGRGCKTEEWNEVKPEDDTLKEDTIVRWDLDASKRVLW